MKYIKGAVLLLAILGIMVSCKKDDGRSLNDIWISTGTIMKTADYFYIETDGGESLWPSASNVDPDLLEDSLRVLVNFTILDEPENDNEYDYYVKVNALQAILTKPVFEFTSETSEATKDSIGNDPITIISSWFNDKYLSLEFEFGGGGNVLHFINLVHDSINSVTENGEIILELKHNRNNDPYYYKQWGVASFDVSALQIEGQDSVSILLRSLNSDGQYDYNKVVTYFYGDQEEVQSAPKVLRLDAFPSKIQ